MTIQEEKKSENVEETKVWSSILQEVRQTDTKKLPANKSLIVLGDNETGKTTLIARMAGLETPQKASGLEYSFIEIRDEYREESTKLSAWILHGGLKMVESLDLALKEKNFEDSCCLLVASMSQPWNIMRSLETWASVLERHIERLEIKPAKLKQCRQRLLLRFLNYVSPSDEAESRLISGVSKLDQSKLREFEDEKSSDQNHEQSNMMNDIVTSASDLGQLTLSRNLGVEVVVVITKTDHISTLEKDYDYIEETFDFIQQAIRKFCLRFGASLFYVSARVNKNCDLLHQYLAHRIYDLPFKASASVVERDAIFVPAGWDNEKKISLLYDNIRSVNPDDDYNEFILERVNPGPAQRGVEVEAEDDQEFLFRMQSILAKTMINPLPSASSLTQQRHQAQGNVEVEADDDQEYLKRRQGISVIKTRKPLPNAPSPAQQRPSMNNQIEAQSSEGKIIERFFNTLLSKDMTMPPTDGPPET